MQIETSSTFGNFDWNATFNVPDSLIPVLCSLGILQVMQRQPSSAAEKQLAGYEKRPEGFKRTSIPFTDENAETLKNALKQIQIETGRDEKGAKILQSLTADSINVVEHVVEERGSTYAAERAKYAEKKSEAELRKLAKAVGYDGDIGTVGGEAPEDFLKAIRSWVRAQTAAL